jgi:hypothetical protein
MLAFPSKIFDLKTFICVIIHGDPTCWNEKSKKCTKKLDIYNYEEEEDINPKPVTKRRNPRISS